MACKRLAIIVIVILGTIVGRSTGFCAESSDTDSPEAALGHIRVDIQHLLATPRPELYQRHLRSLLALCEDSVLRLQFAAADRDAQTKELMGYLQTIEPGAVYVFDRLSRDLRLSLCSLDVTRQCHIRKSPR
jgi:hypothetical protein